MEQFNHRLMSLARDSRGLTQAELAHKSRIGQGTISKYESGLLVPPGDAVVLIAKALDYPTKFFFQDERTFGFPPFHFRKRKKLSKKTLNRIVAEMNIRRMHISRLTKAFELHSEMSIPELDIDEYRGSKKGRPTIEDLARHLREAWMVPPGPIDNMVALIERNGGIVIDCDFGTDLLDAMSQRVDGLPVLFFINSNAPADRVRHTLAHELAHMVLHTIELKDDDEMEVEADNFAGAFLLPADEFRPQMRRFDLRHLANLKSYWKVSMQALAVRADRLNCITPHQSKMFWIEMGKLGYRKREPNEPAPEHPNILKSMIRFHQKKLGYSQQEIAALLDLMPDECIKMYGFETVKPDAPRLRVVN